MKQFIIVLIIIFLIGFLTNISSAGNTYTADNITEFLKKQCKCDLVVLMDEVYEDYPLSRALGKADCTNYKPKLNLFDCDDVAFAVKSLVANHVSEINDSGGAVMFGIAFVIEKTAKGKKEESSGHVVNVGIYERNVYIYDWQEPTDKNLIKIKKYLKKYTIFFIMM